MVAPNDQQAKQKAVQQIQTWESPPRDYLHQVDTLLDLHTLLAHDHYYLDLQETSEIKPFVFTCCYTPIGK